MNSYDLPAVRQHKNLLFDFYGALLTERQREVFAMHYMEDCSHAEIGASMGITPQAVADLLKRSLGRLNRYEELLCLVAKYMTHQKIIAQIDDALIQLENINGWDINHIRKLVHTLNI
ncbi:MAG: DNA-binding protein [Defluviitaleaceae bacterium]|nr:DNA-binding protein [Defluviitaleaceae bacterium]